MYAVFQIAQLLIRLLIYTYIGKALLGLLAGARQRENVVWRFFDAITRPTSRLTRALLPRVVPDRAMGLFAVAGLLLLNLVLYMVFYSQGWLTRRF